MLHCLQAAAELGLPFEEEWDGPGDHPGCLHAVRHGNPAKVNK